MSRWFRHYAGMMRDPKLVGIAVRSKQPVERVLFLWNCILESAAEANTGGTFLIDGDEIAYFLRCEKGDVSAVLLAMEDATVPLIKDGQIVKWSCRQFESDSDPTAGERQTRRRARLKAERERDGASVTHESRVTEGTDTDQSRAGHTAHRAETDTDSKTDSSPSLRSGEARTRKSEPRKRATRLTAEWVPSEADREFARKHGCSEAEIDFQADKIRNWSMSNKNGEKLDWAATWRNWMLDKKPMPRAGPNGHRPRTMTELASMEFPDEPSPSPQTEPESPEPAEPTVLGFAGRLSQPDRDQPGGKLLDLGQAGARWRA